MIVNTNSRELVIIVFDSSVYMNTISRIFLTANATFWMLNSGKDLLNTLFEVASYRLPHVKLSSISSCSSLELAPPI